MNRKLQYFLKITAMLFCMALCSSCIKDNISDCPAKVRIHFTFSTQTINPAYVDQMHLYVFRQDGFFVREYEDESITGFNTNYYMECTDLQPGEYRFIAWGGKDKRFYSTLPVQFTKGQTTFEDALLMLEHPDNKVNTSVHHIFHSNLSVAVIQSDEVQHFYMPLSQLSNTINIHTVGLPANTNVYTFYITDNNCTYTFDGSFASHSHPSFTYSAPCTKDGENQLHATLNVLRLSANRRTPQLQLYNQTNGTILYPVGSQSGDLIDLILKANNHNNFETTHTYDIVLTFTGDESTGFDVDIAINGWKVQGQDDDLY